MPHKEDDTITFKDSENDFITDELKKGTEKEKEEKIPDILTEEIVEDIEEDIISEIGDDFKDADEAEDDALQEDDENDDEDLDDEMLEDDEDEEQSEKKSYPSIDKILKETRNSDYFYDFDEEDFEEDFYSEVNYNIQLINSSCGGDVEKECIMAYTTIHNMTLDFMDRKDDILNSPETVDIYKKFYIYKEVLKEKEQSILKHWLRITSKPYTM